MITADICRYLGNDALVRPGTYEVWRPHRPRETTLARVAVSTVVLTLSLRQDKKSGRVIQGYFVTAYRNLTSVRAPRLPPARP